MSSDSELSATAEAYLDSVKNNGRSKESRVLYSKLQSMIDEELLEIGEKKKNLIYQLHELEGLHESKKVGLEQYHKSHDGIERRISDIEARSKLLIRASSNPGLLVKGRTEVRLYSPLIAVIVELLLILTVVYIYYSIKRSQGI